jgi:predicted thioesterase
MATSFDLGGLLGSAFGGDEYGDLLTPTQQSAIQQRALLSAASALLQAGAPSTTRTSLGQALGAALQAGQTGAEKAQQSALTGMLTRQKLEEARRAKDLQDRIGKLLTPTAAAPSATITPEMALAAPVTEELPAGPTVARAEMIGQAAPAAPAMTQAEMRAQQYRQIADVYAAAGKGEDAKRYMDIAEQLAPVKRNLQVIDVDGRKQVIDLNATPVGTSFGTGEKLQIIDVDGRKEVIDLSKTPVGTSFGTGEKLQVIDVDGKKQVIDLSKTPAGTTFGTGQKLQVIDVDGKKQVFDLNATPVGTTFGKGQNLQVVDLGGRKTIVDLNAVAPGTSFAKTLAPQIVGGAESGYFVVGGGGGGAAAPRAPIAGAPAAAAPGAPARAAAPAAAQAPAAAPAGAPAPAGMVPLIPGTGPKPTEDQSKSAGFAYRMNLANQTFNQPIIDPATQQPLLDRSGRPLTLESVYGVPSRTQAILRAIPSAGVTTGIANYLESEGRQQYRQAQMNWVRANLRAESGAVIGENEMADEIIKYFPQVDDKPATIRQKAEARRAAELAMQVRAGPSYGNIQRAAASTATQPKGGRLERDPKTGNLRYVED